MQLNAAEVGADDGVSSFNPSAAPSPDGKETALVVRLPFLRFPRPGNSDF
jgi:hypothetical protein